MNAINEAGNPDGRTIFDKQVRRKTLMIATERG
jgi:hypothetical protein